MQEIAGFTGLDVMRGTSENQIGQFALPMSIVRDLEVNGKNIPGVCSDGEPSVVMRPATNGLHFDTRVEMRRPVHIA